MSIPTNLCLEDLTNFANAYFTSRFGLPQTQNPTAVSALPNTPSATNPVVQPPTLPNTLPANTSDGYGPINLPASTNFNSSQTPSSYPAPSVQHTPSVVLSQQHQPAPAMNPIIQPYQSARTRRTSGHPALPATQSPSASQQLAQIPAPSTSSANRQRLDHAANSLPRGRSQGLQTRQAHRTRGPSFQTPVLQDSRLSTTLSQVLADGSQTAVRIVAKIYPPSQAKDSLILYTSLYSTVDNFREANCLIHRYGEVPLSETIKEFMIRVQGSMASSPMQYRFHLQENLFTAEHESQDLQLLELVQSGTPRRKDGFVRLRKPNIKIKASMTIANLLETKGQNKSKFSMPSFHVDNGFFIIYLFVRENPLTARINNRLHTCVPEKFYKLFPNDTSVASLEGFNCICDDDSDTEVEDQLMTMFDEPPLPNVAFGNNGLPVNALARELSFLSANSFLPDSIWQQAWLPHEFSAGTYTPDSLAFQIFQKANPHPTDSLVIEGNTLDELVDRLLSVIETCIEINDFSKLLAADRSFLIQNPVTHEIASGMGIQLETFHRAFLRFTENSPQWFVPLLDDRVSIHTMHTVATSRYVSQDRLKSLKTLGALCGMMIVFERAPVPLGPAILQFFFNQRNLHSIHREFVGEHHPYLRQILDDWHDLGPDGDPSAFRPFFASYLSKEVATVRSRDLIAHKALAVEMLYHSLFGPENYHHVEWEAVFSGFGLPCRNGFSLFDVGTNFVGGSEALILHIYSSIISSPDALVPRVRFFDPPRHYIDELRQITGDYTLNCRDFVLSFLRGVGIPSHSLFESRKDSFDPLVSFDTVDKPFFRARIFAWAASGSPTVDPNGSEFNVRFVLDTDIAYHRDNAARTALMANGKIACKTYFQDILIPTSYLISLANQYNPLTMPIFYKHVESWLFCEFVDAIGHISGD